MSDLRPIETTYKGYRFRSRLEARWAVFFDHMDIPWEYEAQGYVFGHGEGYLPDFRLWGAVLGEVKPKESDAPGAAEEIEKLIRFVDDTLESLILLDGMPMVDWYPFIQVGALSDGSVNPSAFEWIDLGMSAAKDRPWLGYEGQKPRTADLYVTGGFRSACDAARAARFEHGESGYTAPSSPTRSVFNKERERQARARLNEIMKRVRPRSAEEEARHLKFKAEIDRLRRDEGEKE